MLLYLLIEVDSVRTPYGMLSIFILAFPYEFILLRFDPSEPLLYQLTLTIIRP